MSGVSGLRLHDHSGPGQGGTISGGGVPQISGSGTGAMFFGATTVEIDSPDSNSSLIIGNETGIGAVLTGAGAPASLSGAGIDLIAGDDNKGIFISEKSTTVVQMYDDGFGTHDIELVDQSTFHWKNVSAAGDASIPALGILRKLASAPGSPVEGESYYDTALHKTRTWDGSAWQNHW